MAETTWWTFGEAKGINQRAQPLMSGQGGTLLECENLSFFQQGAIVQRFGTASQSLTSSGLTGIVEWGGRFTTTGGVEERWLAANNSGTAALARQSGGGAWGAVSFSDTVNVSNLRYIQAASLTSKYFLNYDSNVNRAHVWDGTTLRRVGLAQSTAPTVAQMGGGALSFTRYYRQRFIELSGTTVVRRSEPSASVSITIAAKLGVTVTKGATISEGETHWEVEAADAAVGPWYRIAQVAVGTTTYDDTAATISTTNLSATIGEYVPPPSAKFVLSDTNRVLYAGSWETSGASDQTAPKANRVWYTPVLGTTDAGDDERIPNTVDQQNWSDVGNEGPLTGLAGPLYGDIYAFKEDSVFKLTPTGDFVNPYRVIQVMSGIGAVDQRCICVGELGTGTPAIFFAAASSVYAITSGGIIEIADDIGRDLRMNNFTAASSWIAFDPYDKGLLVQTNSGSSTLSGQYFQFKYDTDTQQWAGYSFGGGQSSWILGRSILGTDTILGGDGSTIRNAFVARNDNGSVRLLLCGQNSAGASLLAACGDVCGVDGATAFTSRFRVRAFPTPGYKFQVGCPTMIYRNPVGTSGVTGTVMVSYLNQNGTIVTSAKQTLDATDQDNPTQMKVLALSDLQYSDLDVLDVRVTLSHSGSFTTSMPPSIDAFMIPVTKKEAIAQ